MRKGAQQVRTLCCSHGMPPCAADFIDALEEYLDGHCSRCCTCKPLNR